MVIERAIAILFAAHAAIAAPVPFTGEMPASPSRVHASTPRVYASGLFVLVAPAPESSDEKSSASMTPPSAPIVTLVRSVEMRGVETPISSMSESDLVGALATPRTDWYLGASSERSPTHTMGRSADAPSFGLASADASRSWGSSSVPSNTVSAVPASPSAPSSARPIASTHTASMSREEENATLVLGVIALVTGACVLVAILKRR